jgi:hypothetical protein
MTRMSTGAAFPAGAGNLAARPLVGVCWNPVIDLGLEALKRNHSEAKQTEHLSVRRLGVDRVAIAAVSEVD